ncbi:DeoR/GlpR family DNA-binding transcription regulator [Stackebrandtia soli]|uniref:DeoR/GlpR family DNA-binding transcription regulator n=1 Tax=Stackebrandtia soli TaxID=1892856 RepID=UPI0039EC1E11
MATESRDRDNDPPARYSRDERQEAIVDHLRANDRIDVAQLAKRFGVTEMTVRRDLAALDGQGRVTRVHGGALPPRPVVYETRATINASAKTTIARAVSTLITEGETVGIDMGTTCHAVATELAKRDDLTIVTYSLHVAMAFRGSRSRVIVLGGEMTEELTLVNGGVVDLTAHLALNTFVAGCAGASPQWGVSYFGAGEVEVRRAMSARADRLVLAADHEKWGQHSTYVLGPLSMFATAVTDAGISEETRESASAHLDLVVAE